jgi:beta-xylosidase
MVGVDGKGVITYKKPDAGKKYPIKDLPTSDEFNEKTLGMQWGWNHNPDSTKWSLTQRPGYLRLTTAGVAANLREARNTLTQRPFAGYDQSIPAIGVAKLETDHMKNGDIAGLAVFQDPYAYIAVQQINGVRQLIMVNNGETVASAPVKQAKVIYLRTLASNSTKKATFEYSYDKKEFTPLGNELTMQFNLKIFTGNKFCLFNYATEATGGYVDFDWFRTGTSNLF